MRAFLAFVAAAVLPTVSGFMRPTPFTGTVTARAISRSSSVLAMSGGEADWVLRQKNVPKKEEWLPLIKATDIAPGDKIPIDTDGLTLLVVADADGNIFCTAGNSPWMSAPLVDGEVKDGTITCPQSRSVFDLETGELLSEWCPFPPVLGPKVLGKIYPASNLAVFPVRSRNNIIEAFLDRNLKGQFEARYWQGLLDATGKATGDYY